MTSLRLALKQSLEESSGGFSPPSIGSTDNPANTSNTTPSSPSAAARATATSSTGSVPIPSFANTSGVLASDTEPLSPNSLKKRGPGRPRKHSDVKQRGRPTQKHGEGDYHSDHDKAASDQEPERAQFSRELSGEEHYKKHIANKLSDAMASQSASDHGSNEPPALPIEATSHSEVKKHKSHDNPVPTMRNKDPAAQGGYKAKTVPAPDGQLLQWSRTLPVKQSRHSAQQGLRVKVRFSTKVKREGKLIRKKRWYGGVVSQVSKAGSKIRIKYDDGTTEVSKFPDKDVVVDDAFNGEHSCDATFFIPPEDMDGLEEEGEVIDVEDDSKMPAKLSAKPEPQPSSSLIDNDGKLQSSIDETGMAAAEGELTVKTDENEPERPSLVERETSAVADGSEELSKSEYLPEPQDKKTEVMKGSKEDSTASDKQDPRLGSPVPTSAGEDLVDTPVPPESEPLELDPKEAKAELQISTLEDIPSKPLSIRIPNVKAKKEPKHSPMELEEKDEFVSGEKTPKRIHISLSKSNAADKEKGSEEGLEKPEKIPEAHNDRLTPSSDAGDAADTNGSHSPFRQKKAKRKRVEAALPDTPLETTEGADESQVEANPAASGLPENEAKPLTPRSRMGKPAKRAATDEGKDDSAVDPVSKKKKKRDRRKDGDGEESEEKEESQQQAPWVQCDKCKKWRIIPSDVVGSLPDRWFCEDNVWDPKRASCDAPQQKDKQLVRERKRRKRQRLLEKEQEKRAAATDMKDAPPEEPVGEKTPAPSFSEETSDAPPKKKAKRASPTEEQAQLSDSSVHKERPVKVEKEKKKGSKKSRKEIAHSESIESSTQEAPESKPKRGRPRRNAGKEAKPSTTNKDRGQEENPENLEWVQCEKCEKWRKLPPHVSADELPDVWYCSMNTWNPDSASCTAPEDKAEGLTDIFNSGADKLSYRNLIFGNGRKFNRPISERTRAAESIFASVSDDTDTPPAVAYANSSAFISRSKLNHMDENDGFSVLDLMSRSSLWEDLRLGVNGGKGLCPFDNLSPEIKESMKDLILQSLGEMTMSGEEIANEIKHRDWGNVPLGWAAARPHCSLNSLVMSTCELVKEGVLECIKLYPEGSEKPYILGYRRNYSFSKMYEDLEEETISTSADSGGPRSKFTKPWKSI